MVFHCQRGVQHPQCAVLSARLQVPKASGAPDENVGIDLPCEQHLLNEPNALAAHLQIQPKHALREDGVLRSIELTEVRGDKNSINFEHHDLLCVAVHLSPAQHVSLHRPHTCLLVPFPTAQKQAGRLYRHFLSHWCRLGHGGNTASRGLRSSDSSLHIDRLHRLVRHHPALLRGPFLHEDVFARRLSRNEQTDPQAPHHLPLLLHLDQHLPLALCSFLIR